MDIAGAPQIQAQPPGMVLGKPAQLVNVQCALDEIGLNDLDKPVETKLGLRSQLSMVPEQSFIISWRIELLVIGCCAEQWCTRAVDSKIAEAYRPHSTGVGSERLWLFIPLQPKEDRSPREATGVRSPRERRLSQSMESANMRSMTSSDLMGSTPRSISGVREELARLRFSPIQGFGDNLNLPTDPEKCINYIAVLLVVPADTSLKERMWDFQMRLSEISFKAKHMRPHVVMLTFNTDAAQDEQLEEFTAKWRDRVPIEVRAYKEDSEEEIMEALADTCRSFIEKKLKHALASGTITEASVQQTRKRCPISCTVM